MVQIAPNEVITKGLQVNPEPSENAVVDIVLPASLRNH